MKRALFSCIQTGTIVHELMHTVGTQPQFCDLNRSTANFRLFPRTIAVCAADVRRRFRSPSGTIAPFCSYDRDQYIDIVWPNVINGADDQFEKVRRGEARAV